MPGPSLPNASLTVHRSSWVCLHICSQCTNKRTYCICCKHMYIPLLSIYHTLLFRILSLSHPTTPRPPIVFLSHPLCVYLSCSCLFPIPSCYLLLEPAICNSPFCNWHSRHGFTHCKCESHMHCFPTCNCCRPACLTPRNVVCM